VLTGTATMVTNEFPLRLFWYLWIKYLGALALLYKRYDFDISVVLCLVSGYKVVPLPDYIRAVFLATCIV